MQSTLQKTSIPFEDLPMNFQTDSMKKSEPKTQSVIETDVAVSSNTADEEQNDKDVKNHFTDIPKDFLEDITEVFEEFNISDFQSAINFDVELLSSKLIAKGRMADLVKDLLTQWKNALQEALEQQKRIEGEIERKKRAQRPVWRCAACGRPSNPGCSVAPYIESYVDVDI